MIREEEFATLTNGELSEIVVKLSRNQGLMTELLERYDTQLHVLTSRLAKSIAHGEEVCARLSDVEILLGLEDD